MQAFGRLLDIMDELRAKCPWDGKQTFDSLRPLSIEELYELSDALVKKNYDDVCKELGDLLMHITFYAKIGEEKQLFDIQDVCEHICEKLVYRHPHIYGDTVAETAKAVEQNWEKLKLREKGGNKTVLAGVPDGLPSMVKAYRMQDKARGVGFDWSDPQGAWDKVQEEISEVRQEMDALKSADKAQSLSETDRSRLESEFGDLFFSLINVARLYKVNPDNALEHTNLKFHQRFDYLEEKTLQAGRQLKDMTLEEMDALWEESKQLYR